MVSPCHMPMPIIAPSLKSNWTPQCPKAVGPVYANFLVQLVLIATDVGRLAGDLKKKGKDRKQGGIRMTGNERSIGVRCGESQGVDDGPQGV
jgi:hypothetical protein